MITFILCFLYFFVVAQSESFNSTNITNYDDNYLLPRVYNGWAAKLGDVPYQVSFKQRRPRRFIYRSFCGGVIIEPAKLLSAAHCFADKPKICEKLCSGSGKLNKKMLSHIVAVAGQLTNIAKYSQVDSLEDGQWRRIVEVRYPPDYSFPRLDIALVFLEDPFKFDKYVSAIPFASRFVDYDGKCLVSGFGRTSPHTGSDILLLAHLTLIPWKTCNRMHRKSMRRFVCTSSQYTDVGKGDSGGPLVCSNTGDPQEGSRGVLVGIVSGHAYGVGSFFTRVSSYYAFVLRNKSCTENTYLHWIFMLNLLQLRFLLF